MITFTKYLEARSPAWLANYFTQAKTGTLGKFGQKKALMSPEEKQAHWAEKLTQATLKMKVICTNEYNYLLSVHQDPPFRKLIDIIYHKIMRILDELQATYRKGGEVTPGTISTLTRKGWSEGTQDIIGKFQQIKSDFIAGLTPYVKMTSNDIRDKDVASMVMKIASMLIQKIKNIGLSGVPGAPPDPIF